MELWGGFKEYQSEKRGNERHRDLSNKFEKKEKEIICQSKQSTGKQ